MTAFPLTASEPGPLILAVDFTGRDPAGELRFGADGKQLYTDRDWDFANNQLLEVVSPATLRARLPADHVARHLFFTGRRWHTMLEAALDVTFETGVEADGKAEPAFVGLRVRDSHYLFVASHGRCAVVHDTHYLKYLEEHGDWNIAWQEHPALVPGAGACNRLRVLMKEIDTAFYVNDALIGTAQVGAGLHNIGWIDIIACAGSVWLDNIELRDPVLPAPFDGPPVVLEVRATDALTTASGAPSGEGTWTFYLQAPQQWALAPDLTPRVQRVTARIYAAMNRRAEGGSYILHGVTVQPVSAAPVGQTFYVLQPDESVEQVGREPPNRV